ncbi:unnamed protein product [Oncorhynchus mykiss]|uniref:Uncharacterized protein n=1 Tax=Oncorhynchus mykiss TaxID=8022 RepID=A0A060YXF7_ONCMY|nr:unnamed protein product [Oncorhynchus mykiss]
MQNGYNEIGFVQQILSLNLVPRKNGTNRGNDTSLSDFSDVVWSLLVGCCLFTGVPPTCCSPGPRHPATTQNSPLHAHCHHTDEYRGPCVWWCPYQCRHCWGVQSSREEDDLLGGLGVWSGPVFLCPHYLLLKNPSYTLALGHRNSRREGGGGHAISRTAYARQLFLQRPYFLYLLSDDFCQLLIFSCNKIFHVIIMSGVLISTHFDYCITPW